VNFIYDNIVHALPKYNRLVHKFSQRSTRLCWNVCLL